MHYFCKILPEAPTQTKHFYYDSTFGCEKISYLFIKEKDIAMVLGSNKLHHSILVQHMAELHPTVKVVKPYIW